jgi:hypothetical protein
MGVFAEQFPSNGHFFGSLFLAVRLHVTMYWSYIVTRKQRGDLGIVGITILKYISEEIFYENAI